MNTRTLPPQAQAQREPRSEAWANDELALGVECAQPALVRAGPLTDREVVTLHALANIHARLAALNAD